MGRDNKEDPTASTELDLKLPTDIAVRHAEESFESKETLLRVELPETTSEIKPPTDATPPFDPAHFPALRQEDHRSTEHVDLPTFKPQKNRQTSPLLWVLLGAAIAIAITLGVYFIALR
jgi:hypothetical protein